MITREADYAIRVILYLAMNTDKAGPVAADVLAEEMHIPYRFLRRIVLRLVKGGLVKTMRGRGGGMCAARPIAAISLRDVILAINPRSLTLNECLSGASTCPRTRGCTVRREVAKVQKTLRANLHAVRFGQLMKPASAPASKCSRRISCCN
jgi:Rrf2 family protein